MDDTAFIIATKDRPVPLRNLLTSISAQQVTPGQIIIIDSSRLKDYKLADEFPGLPISHIPSHPPSAARQRNEGLAHVTNKMKYVGFIDDDAVIEDKAFEAMDKFWSIAPPFFGGAGFNLINHPPLFAEKLKSFPLTDYLGFYSTKRGIVLPSGFQTMIGTVDKDKEVQWLPSGAVVWRKYIFNTFSFDEWFRGYSYLEDLDFSYTVGKKFKLIVVSNARYRHMPALEGRCHDYAFGKKEVMNRIYFVNKNKNLSIIKCYLALIVRSLINIFLFLSTYNHRFITRFCGNLSGIINSPF